MIPGVIQSKAFTFESSLKGVRPAADLILEFLKGARLSDEVLFDIRLCIEESLINAIKYGNREKGEIPVKVDAAYSGREVFLAVEDQGAGFDPSKLQDPTCGDGLEACSGRGVFLIKKLMDKVIYSPKGNRVEMVKVYKHARV